MLVTLASACEEPADTTEVRQEEDPGPDHEGDSDSVTDGSYPVDGVVPGPVDFDVTELTGASVACDEVVAVLTRDNGNQLVFCLHGDGAMSIGEVGHLDSDGAPLEIGERCLDSVFRDEAGPDVDVPAALLEACAEYEGSRGGSITPQTGSRNGAHAGQGELAGGGSMRSHYCGGNGPDEFFDEVCDDWYQLGAGADQYFCQTVCTAWHQRSSNFKAADGDEIQAACVATTRMRRFERENAWPYDWNTKLDVEIAANYWFHHWFYEGVGQLDHYQRFRGDAYGSGCHRYAGLFND